MGSRVAGSLSNILLEKVDRFLYKDLSDLVNKVMWTIPWLFSTKRLDSGLP